MANNTSSRHFDAVALLTHVSKQETGLRVSSNDPANFRRILYETMAAQPSLKCYVYQDPTTPQAFLLLRRRLEQHTEVNNEEGES